MLNPYQEEWKKNKWVKIITNDNKHIDITDMENLYYLDFEEEEPKITQKTEQIEGTDGVIPNNASFEPFELTLRFAFDGLDKTEYRLFKSSFRKLWARREPFYVVHSDLEGFKYAVIFNSLSFEDKFSKNGEAEVSLLVYKGYTESYLNTLELDYWLKNGWQFENGLSIQDGVKYVTDSKTVKIYNESSDEIDPDLRHTLIIKVKGNAPNGFKIKNKTNKKVYEYKKSIKNKDEIVINGVYTYKNKKRVTHDTNYKLITLEPGINDIEITGDGLELESLQFIFNFIYR